MTYPHPTYHFFCAINMPALSTDQPVIPAIITHLLCSLMSTSALSPMPAFTHGRSSHKYQQTHLIVLSQMPLGTSPFLGQPQENT